MVEAIHIASVDATTLGVGDVVEQSNGRFVVVSVGDYRETEAGRTPEAFFLLSDNADSDRSVFMLAVNARGYTGSIRWYSPPLRKEGTG